ESRASRASRPCRGGRHPCTAAISPRILAPRPLEGTGLAPFGKHRETKQAPRAKSGRGRGQSMTAHPRSFERAFAAPAEPARVEKLAGDRGQVLAMPAILLTTVCALSPVAAAT